MWLNNLLEKLRSFASSFHKLVLSVLRILHAYIAITGKATPKRRNAKMLNALMGW